jgi:hypothetical protein
MSEPKKTKAALPKQLRFAQLVKDFGRPEVMTLWTKLEDNPPFMKAVRQNRVLTVAQNATGSHTDSGEIAFHPKPSAMYYVFPKSLPKAPGARVVGIKYDLIEEKSAKVTSIKMQPGSKIAPGKRISKRQQEIPPAGKSVAPLKEKPAVRKKFSVTILRIATQEIKLSVPGDNLQEAEGHALEIVKKKKFSSEHMQDEIKAIAEI